MWRLRVSYITKKAERAAIVATSGHSNNTVAAFVKIKYILNGGKSKIGVESTILNLLEKPSLLRYGGLDTKKIENVLKKKLLIEKIIKVPR